MTNAMNRFDPVASQLVLEFDVQVDIRSPINEHNMKRYVAGGFQTAEEKQAFVDFLRGTGCSQYRFVDAADVKLPTSTTRQDSGGDGKQAGLIAGIVAALSAVAILVALFIFTRIRHRSSSLVDSEDDDRFPFAEGVANNELVSEIGVRTAHDVSTLGDPIPPGASPGAMDVSTTAGSISLDYDFQKAYLDEPSVSVISGASRSDVIADDDTLSAQYAAPEERLEVSAPSGMLGIVLETAPDGTPVVKTVRPSSVLADQVDTSDRLVNVDDMDVTAMLASDVSKLISSKKDQKERKLVFMRPVKRKPSLGATDLSPEDY